MTLYKVNKLGHTVLSYRLPPRWATPVATFLDTYPIQGTILQIMQRSVKSRHKHESKRRGTLTLGTYTQYEKINRSGDAATDLFHYVRLWFYEPNSRMLKTLLHELGHAYLSEQDWIWGTSSDSEEAADQLAANILYQGVLPPELKSFTGMSREEINEYEKLYVGSGGDNRHRGSVRRSG